MSLQAHLLRSFFFLTVGYLAAAIAWYVASGEHDMRGAAVGALLLLIWDLLVMRPRCQDA